MKRRMKTHAMVVLAFVSSLGLAARWPNDDDHAAQFFVKDFELQSTALVEAPGEAVATLDFEPEGWYPATVPTTVLRALVAAGIYPDPYVGLNNMAIPDAHDGFNATYDLAQYSHMPNGENPWSSPYYFRSEFTLPYAFKGSEVVLTFEGINYRADVWLNGQKVGDSESLVGMFETFRLRVTDAARPGRKNVLAVAIHPLDTPGEPAPPQLEPLGPFGENGGATGDIGKNVTMQSSVGWDWIPAVRDRNMGIWQDVYFQAVRPVDIRHSRVITDLPLPDTNTARLTVETELVNLSDRVVDGVLKAVITSPGARCEVARVSRAVTIQGDSVAVVRFEPDDFEALTVRNPKLWWPNLMGKQPLYGLKLVFAEGSVVSDRDSIRFGIREVSSEVTFEPEARRQFFVNGEKVQLRGGSWVPDMLLARDRDRYEKELMFSKEANFNLVRIWGGGLTPPDAFFEICDSLGLLVWHDFWITGDCQGTWHKGTRDWPLEGDVFLSNALSVVKRIRHHPSLLVWTGGNEGYAREEIYMPLRNEIVAQVDGTRPFLASSGVTAPEDLPLSWPDDQPTGAYSGGPYWWVSPETYYEDARVLGDWLHKDEIGVAAVPPMRSLRKFLTEIDDDQSDGFSLTTELAYHDAMEASWGGPMFSAYDTAIRTRYGEVTTLEEYAQKAQAQTAENLRAIFEAANSSMDRVAGVLLWKTNASWPSVIWQVYDWYLRPNAGYYYAKRAGEPLHVQLDLDTRQVRVINRTRDVETAFAVKAEVYRVHEGATTLEAVERMTVLSHPMSAKDGPTVVLPEGEPDLFFIKLTMTDSGGDLVSDNIYWISRQNDLEPLSRLSVASLSVSAGVAADANTLTVALKVENVTDVPAFFVNFLILNGKGGEEVLPTIWSDNYLVLLPGEKRRLTAKVAKSALSGRPYLGVEGWNTPTEELAVLGLPHP